MKTKLLILILLIGFKLNPLHSQDFLRLRQLSSSFLLHLKEGKHEAIYSCFDSTMQSVMKPVQIARILPSLEAQFGTYQTWGAQDTAQSGEYSLVFTTMEFARGKLRCRLAFNRKQEISGIFFEPVKEEAVAAEGPGFSEEDFLVVNGPYRLPGFLTLPRPFDHRNVVVFVHGSGPHDRDGTIGPNTPLKDLAYGLAAEGIASLRYDKRTYIYGNTSSKEPEKLTLQEETIEDALQAVKQLKEMPRFRESRIFLAGHSLGAYAAPAMALQSDLPDGIIMMAGNARPMEDLLEYQYEYLTKPDGVTEAEAAEVGKLKKQIAELRKMQSGEEYNKNNLPMGLPAAYWEYLNHYDPTESLINVEIPVLIIQGERDYQVTMKDYELFREALAGKSNITFISYPELNHLFMEGEGPSSPAEYLEKRQVPEYVSRDLAGWIRKN